MNTKSCSECKFWESDRLDDGSVKIQLKSVLSG
jgi:hypothetical protein